MKDNKFEAQLPLFTVERMWIFSDKPCEVCSRSDQVLNVLGKFTGESFSCFRYLCCFCRSKLIYILGKN